MAWTDGPRQVAETRPYWGDMGRLSVRQGAVVVGLALVGWALCAATMGIGMSLLGLQVTLVVHAVAAPIVFATISLIYFKRFAYTSPMATAATFLAIVVFMDVAVVAVLALHSFAMFASFVGTWLPFTLIFASTYLTGRIIPPRGRAGIGS